MSQETDKRIYYGLLIMLALVFVTSLLYYAYQFVWERGVLAQAKYEWQLRVEERLAEIKKEKECSEREQALQLLINGLNKVAAEAERKQA